MDEIKTKLLKSVEEIAQYLGVSKHIALKYIALGMPATIILNRYHAHPDNIEEFFRGWTRQQIENPPDDLE